MDELKEVLSGNVNYACDYIEKHFEGVNVSKPEGTYMLSWTAQNGAKNMERLLQSFRQQALK